jgi:hypothetical protein
MTDAARKARRRRVLQSAMIAFIKAKGVSKAAAADYGCKERTMRELVAEYCLEFGYATPVEAAFEMGQRVNYETWGVLD